jgi:hypothetical protein
MIHGNREDAEHLMRLLVRDQASFAPSFSSGNLLIHGFSAEGGHSADSGTVNFRDCAANAPGLHYTCLFPVTSSVETTDRFTDKAAQIVFRRNGKALELSWRKEGRRWSPWLVEDLFEGDNLVVRQAVAIASGAAADVLGCRIDLSGDLEGVYVEVIGKVFRDSSLVWADNRISGEIIRESENFKFVSGPWKGNKPPTKAVGARYALFTNLPSPVPVNLSGKESDTYRLAGKPGTTLWVLFAAGFERSEVDGELSRAAADLDGFLGRAKEPWLNYFQRDVPALHCSESRLERVYAELFACGLINTFDVPYDPFRHPFTVPAAKTVSNWHQQFWHDSLFHSRQFLWLNDPNRCKQDLLQMADVQFIHSAPDLGEPYPDPAILIQPAINMLALTGWDIYSRSPDRAFLSTVLDRLMDYDRRKCRPRPADAPVMKDIEEPPFSWLHPYRDYDSDRDWLISSELTGDDTCRADPFLKGTRPKMWYEGPEVTLEPADTNLYLLGNRLAMRRMAEALGDKKICAELDEVIAKQRSAMDRLMWLEKESRYADIVEKSHEVSSVRDIGNITTAIYGGDVDRDRAKRVMTDLLDPTVFWTPLPCPSCPVNHAGVNGKPGFHPDGYWRGRVWGLHVYEALLGLYRYGQAEHAAFLLHRFFDTLARLSTPAPENFNPLNRETIGTAFMSFSSQMVHPFLSFTTGLIMVPGDDLEFDPIALDPEWARFSFGPFQYRPNAVISAAWDPKEGYRVRVNDQTWKFPIPSRFKLLYTDGVYKLDEASVQPIHFAGKPPVAAQLEHSSTGEVQIRLINKTIRQVSGSVLTRQLILNQGLSNIGENRFSLAPGSEQLLSIGKPADSPKGTSWALSAIRVAGYPVTYSEGLGL